MSDCFAGWMSAAAGKRPLACRRQVHGPHNHSHRRDSPRSATLARGRWHVCLSGLLQPRKLLFDECQPFAFAQYGP
jgi:hypothetical protein